MLIKLECSQHGNVAKQMWDRKLRLLLASPEFNLTANRAEYFLVNNKLQAGLTTSRKHPVSGQKTVASSSLYRPGLYFMWNNKLAKTIKLANTQH